MKDKRSSQQFPAWAPKAGVVFAAVTLVFFMTLVLLSIIGKSVPENAGFPIVSVLALGLAFASAFMGGDAATKGQLPFPFLNQHPVQFSVAGGIAVFVIVFLLGIGLYPSEANHVPDKDEQSDKTEIIGGELGDNPDGIKMKRRKLYPKPDKESETGEHLKVWADSFEGTLYHNKTGRYAQVNFAANGTWLAIPENISDPDIPKTAKGYITSNGDPNFESNVTQCRVPLGALIVRENSGQCKRAYGEGGSFELGPGESVYFLMNDISNPKLYEDNRGFVDVQLSISEK